MVRRICIFRATKDVTVIQILLKLLDYYYNKYFDETFKKGHWAIIFQSFMSKYGLLG